MGDLTQVQLLPVESRTAKRGEPDLTEQEIALIVTAGGGRYVELLQNTPGRMETVILFASPQTETTLGLRMSRFNVAAVQERIAKSDDLFAKAAASPPRFACGCPSYSAKKCGCSWSVYNPSKAGSSASASHDAVAA